MKMWICNTVTGNSCLRDRKSSNDQLSKKKNQNIEMENHIKSESKKNGENEYRMKKYCKGL